VKVGVVSLVMLSVLEMPLSLAATRSGVLGVAGMTVIRTAVGVYSGAKVLPDAVGVA
jgi:hypothetical protein